MTSKEQITYLEKRLTQKDISENLNISPRYIRYIKEKKRKASFALSEKINSLYESIKLDKELSKTKSVFSKKENFLKSGLLKPNHSFNIKYKNGISNIKEFLNPEIVPDDNKTLSKFIYNNVKYEKFRYFYFNISYIGKISDKLSTWHYRSFKLDKPLLKTISSLVNENISNFYKILNIQIFLEFKENINTEEEKVLTSKQILEIEKKELENRLAKINKKLKKG